MTQVQKRISGIALLVALLCGCAGQTPIERPYSQEPVDLVSGLRAYAQSDNRDSLLHAIQLLEAYATTHPDDYESRARLANAYTLLGAGYTHKVLRKEAAYAAAIRYAEEAMLTVPGFAHVWRGRGIGFTLALQQLDHRHIEAMTFWKAAVLYDYEECTGSMGRVLRFAELRRAVAMMDRLAQIDRNVGDGNNLMAQGLYRFNMPEYLNGDLQLAEQLLAEAVEVNQRNIVPRWGRARYYALPAGDRELFRQDLRWVVDQPLDNLVGYRPWNIVIQRDARRMLKKFRSLFKT